MAVLPVASVLLPAPHASAAAPGVTYYVSPDGSDANPGTSAAAPWRTPAKAASFHYRPGDTVAFAGGATFTSPLSVWASVNGVPAAPVTFTSYGAGHAHLAGGVYLAANHDLVFSDLAISNATGPGFHAAGAGPGTRNITVEDATVTSTYDPGVSGGYGVASTNPKDAAWTLERVTVADTPDSGVFLRGRAFRIDHSTFAHNGTGASCRFAPCHAIYAKGPAVTVTDSTMTDPESVGVSLRDENDVVQGNTISGGRKGIAFDSETAAPGTTYILANILSSQRDTGIALRGGPRALRESFVVANNTVYRSGRYGLYLGSGPRSATSQTVTLANNLLRTTRGRSYLNLAFPFTYTRATFAERHNGFSGSTRPTPVAVNGRSRTWRAYRGWLGAGLGQGDLLSDPRLDPATLTPGDRSPVAGAATPAVPGVSYDCAAAIRHLCTARLGAR